MRRFSTVCRLCTLLLVCLMLLGACRARPEAPEEAVREAIAQAAEAAEKRDPRAISGFLSGDYRDGQGRDREALLGILRYYFLGHQSVYLLTRVRSVELTAGEKARAVVLVALAGEPLADPSEPTFLRASLYHFDLDFIRENDSWKVRQARWQRAELSDFLLGND
jgi:hypothetical protein